MIQAYLRDERGNEVRRGIRPPEGFEMTQDRVREFMEAGGNRVVKDLVDSYHVNDATEPNRFVQEGTGTRRTHFWNQVADSVEGPEINGATAKIRIHDHRIRQKVYGGTIEHKNVDYLTIPMHPEAYARRAAELESIVGNLFVVRKKDGRLFLAGKKDKALTFYYRLKPSVYQDPWPTAIFKRASLIDSFRNGVNEWFRSLRK
jgi:hypothetical protein